MAGQLAPAWKPGQSGNPGGRPKGIARRARELLGNDPEQLLTVLLAVAQDEKAKDSDRIAAVREYLDRGWCKAPAYAPIEDGDPLGLEDVDRELASVLDELAARREAKTAQPAAKRTMVGSGSNGSAPAGG